MLLFASLVFIGYGLAAARETQDGASPAPAALDRPFTLKPGTSVMVGNERVQVRFDRVLSDSRCPKDVRCIQAGEAVLRVQVTAPGKARDTLELSTSPTADTATAGNYTLKLTAVEPQAAAGRPTRVDEYRATFVLSRQ